MGGQPVQGAQTLFRAINILQVVAARGSSATASEISAELELSPSTAYRLIRALESVDMLIVDHATKRYSLGPELVRLADSAIAREDLSVAAHPSLERLRHASGETAGLHWRVGNERLCLVELPSHHPMKVWSGMGRTYSLLRGAASKAVLSALPDGMASSLIDELGAATEMAASELDRIHTEVRHARETGYATSSGETVSGATAIAAPVRRPDGGVGALNITGPEGRMTPDHLESLKGPLVREAQALSERLGAPGSPRSAVAAGGPGTP